MGSASLSTYVMCFWFGIVGLGVMIPPLAAGGVAAMYRRLHVFRLFVEMLHEEASSKAVMG